jgi:nucleosome binding factor SPN SPT16 subunit
MVLSLSLQANGISYCPCPVPWGAIKEQQEEQERRNRKEQLNKLFNELIKQGETIEITTDKDVKLLIKRRKAVGTTVVNRKLSLTECILDGIGIIMFCCLPFLALIIIDRLG